MKILAIRLKNLTSIEGTVEVDFMAEPLHSAGIFAISGPTGAGKSTLLDALCLALYDKAPRFATSVENVNLADVGDNQINQSDVRNLLRRGTSDGYAEVDFLGIDGRRYRSRWSVRRTRNKINGSLQPQTLEVKELDTEKEFQGTKKELLIQLVELVGLTYEQFTRTVLLAQNDFATFLKSKGAAKAELLEKLTGTGVYSRISQEVYARNKAAQEEVTLIQNRMNVIELMPEEELLALQKEKELLAEKRVTGIKLLAEQNEQLNVVRSLKMQEDLWKKKQQENLNRQEREENEKRMKMLQERQKKEIAALRALRDAENSLIEDSAEKQRATINASYDDQIEDLKRYLETEGNLTPKAKAAVNETIDRLNKKRTADLAKVNEKEMRNQLQQEADYIRQKLELSTEGDYQEYDLKAKLLKKEMEIELSNTELTTEQKKLIEERYQKKLDEMTSEHEREKQEKAMKAFELELSNRLAEAKIAGEDELQVELENAKKRLDSLQQLEGESDAEFKARQLEAQQEYLDAKEELAQREIEIEQAKLDAASQITGALSGLFEQLGESNKAFLILSKRRTVG